MYDLLPETGLFASVEIEKIVKSLQRQGLIARDEHGLVQLTAKGASAQAEYVTTHYVPEHLSINQSYDVKFFKSFSYLPTKRFPNWLIVMHNSIRIRSIYAPNGNLKTG